MSSPHAHQRATNLLRLVFDVAALLVLCGMFCASSDESTSLFASTTTCSQRTRAIVENLIDLVKGLFSPQ